MSVREIPSFVSLVCVGRRRGEEVTKVVLMAVIACGRFSRDRIPDSVSGSASLAHWEIPRGEYYDLGAYTWLSWRLYKLCWTCGRADATWSL